ncbi:MAG: glycosyltransferase family 2 protein [Candidatus Accumulibacter sp.]|nr:glycosyltransferase family 2 protein [Accumulibacter sp.]
MRGQKIDRLGRSAPGRGRKTGRSVLPSSVFSNGRSLNITVVIPTRDRARLIERSLDSLRRQRRGPRQIMVVDDASRDGTPGVVRAWGERHGQPVRIEALARNVGPAAARNHGIRLACTPYVAFLDSDDEHLPDTLERLCGALDAHPDAVLAFGDATVVGPDGRAPHGLFAPHIDLGAEAEPLDDAMFALRNATDRLLPASIIPTSATCFRRDAALDVGGMPDTFRSGEDWLFWLRLAQRGRFVFTPDDLALHHRHDDNLTAPAAGEFIAREKLRGLLDLRSGKLGVPLSTAQRSRVEAMLARQWRDWRYHLSRLGLRAYLAGLRSPLNRAAGMSSGHVIHDLKAMSRAAAASMGLLK